MAVSTIPCRVCGTPLAPDAPACPKCATPDPRGVKAKTKLFTKLLALAMIVGGLGYLWFVYIPDVREHGILYNPSQGK